MGNRWPSGNGGTGGTSADASTTVKGISKLSTAPVAPTNPIAAGDNDPRLSDTRVPTDGSVTAAKVNTALKPSGSAATGDEALRALGSGSTQAAAGDDSRFPTPGQKNALAGSTGTPGSGNTYVTDTDPRNSDQRTPPDGSVTAVKVNAALKPSGTAAAGTEALRALGTTASTATAGNDSRLSDARTPTTHAASHASGGSDPVTLAESQVTNLVTDLAAKAPLASPALTGTPTVPTAAQGTNTTQAASTAYVQTETGLLIPKSLVDAKGDLLVGTADNTVARKAVGSNGQVLAADSTQADGLKWVSADQVPILVAPFAPILANGIQAMGAISLIRAVRVVVPKTGTLSGVAVFVGAASGNARVGIYDTSATTRNRLWDSGSVAVVGTNAYQDYGNPGLAVVKGDNLDFALIADNNTATFGRYFNNVNNIGSLPAGYWPSPLGGAAKTTWYNSPGSFILPATIAESSMSVDSNLWMLIIGKIT